MVNGTFPKYALVPSEYRLLLRKSIDATEEGIATMLCSRVAADAALEHAWIMPGQ